MVLRSDGAAGGLRVHSLEIQRNVPVIGHASGDRDGLRLGQFRLPPQPYGAADCLFVGREPRQQFLFGLLPPRQFFIV